MGGRWIYLFLWAVAASPLWSLEFDISTTWNGGKIDHDPIHLELVGSDDQEYLEVSISAPFFNDSDVPDGPSGQPTPYIWDLEAVELYFLNDDDQYLQVDISPYGHHFVALFNGPHIKVRVLLPLEVVAKISGNQWTGSVKIPAGYLPQNVTKFNAYGMHGPENERTYESLYPAPKDALKPDNHALEYFKPIDLSEALPDQASADMSELWEDALEGIFRYRITTMWNSVPIKHVPAMITLQGYTHGVEMNVTAPFFNDPAPDGTPGEPFYGLWDYEVVEMFFLNDNDEYLEVELGPWGEHLLLILKGARNALKHSLALDYVILEKVDPKEDGTPGQWKGSAFIPPGYFPPNVTRMNAYAIHGVDKERQYQSLYPAPQDDPDYPQPDFHRLELFRPIDFEFLSENNTEYSELWEEAIHSDSTTISPVTERAELEEEMEEQDMEEEVEVTTILGPSSDDDFLPIFAPVNVKQTRVEVVNKPNPQLVSFNEPREQRREEDQMFRQQVFNSNAPRPQPQPVRVGNREIESNTRRRRPQGQVPQRQTFGTSGLNTQRRPLFPVESETGFTNQRQPQDQFVSSNIRKPSVILTQQLPQFQNKDQSSFQQQNPPRFQNQASPQFVNQGQSQFQNNRNPQFQSQSQSLFDTEQQTNFQSQGQSQFQNQGSSQFTNQNLQQTSNQNSPQFQFQNQGNLQFQNERPPQSQNERVPQFQEERNPQFQVQDTVVNQLPTRFQEQTRPSIQSQEQSLFEEDSIPSTQFTEQSFHVPESEPSADNVASNAEVHQGVTQEVEEAMITLSENTPALPPPHPICFELGLVPDPQRCHVFHECVFEDNEWKMFSWQCGRGQRFDPINVACVRGRCSRRTGIRRRRIQYY